MKRINRPNPLWVCALLGLLLIQSRADYTLSILQNGASRATIGPGDSFNLGVYLSSNETDTHDAAVFRVNFSAPGLLFDSYSWSPPYQTGTLEDDSHPTVSLLPVMITPELISGGIYPPNVVDIQFSNITPEAGQSFDTGKLLNLGFTIPVNYSGPDNILIDAVPLEFVRGVQLIGAIPGQTFTLTIPEPVSGAIFIVGMLAAAFPRLIRKSAGIIICRLNARAAKL